MMLMMELFFVDGHNVKDFNRRELRDAFGMVLQDTWLYKGTIMENIRYGKLDATDEEVIAAAKAANAHHFIETLPAVMIVSLTRTQAMSHRTEAAS